MSLMVLLAFFFISPGGRLKGQRACGQSQLSPPHGPSATANHTLLHSEAGLPGHCD